MPQLPPELESIESRVNFHTINDLSLEEDKIISGNFGLVAICVTHPLWPVSVPRSCKVSPISEAVQDTKYMVSNQKFALKVQKYILCRRHVPEKERFTQNCNKRLYLARCSNALNKTQQTQHEYQSVYQNTVNFRLIPMISKNGQNAFIYISNSFYDMLIAMILYLKYLLKVYRQLLKIWPKV